MRHATIAAIFAVWCGAESLTDIEYALRRLWAERLVCGWPLTAVAYGDVLWGPVSLSKRLPTCPTCAVLYDEAMTAREEFLGRREAA